MRRKYRDSGQWSILWLLMSAALVVAVVKADGVSPSPHGQVCNLDITFSPKFLNLFRGPQGKVGK